MRHSYKTEAIVIRGRDLSERDRIVTFISPSEGKFDAVCKGAKKVVAKTSARYEPLNMLKLSVTVGRNLDTVEQSELVTVFPEIRKTLEATAQALYYLDIINRSLEKREENHRIYNLVKKSLLLMEGGQEMDILTRAFEAKFLVLMGYKPVTDSCCVCGDPGGHLRVDFCRGGVICPKCSDLSGEGETSRIMPGTLQALKFLLKCRLDSLSTVKFHDRIGNELKEVLRNMIEFNNPGAMANRRCYDTLG
ncbi:MAG: DNA repair protein RecO [Firmicutes bacterium]|nr:DNA repair protein RecO [Bacillota bacterium]